MTDEHAHDRAPRPRARQATLPATPAALALHARDEGVARHAIVDIDDASPTASAADPTD